MPCKLIGIVGGSCSGKAYFAERLQEMLGFERCQIISQDWYYRDQSTHFDQDGGAINFDDPASIDFALLHQHLLQLKQHQSIHVPCYDFTTHKRLPHCEPLPAADIILVEGALILTQPAIVELLTESVFLNVAEPIRLARRIRRDTRHRGRTQAGVLEQFENHVKPMHDRWIEPSKALATYQVFDDQGIEETLQALVEKLKDVKT